MKGIDHDDHEDHSPPAICGNLPAARTGIATASTAASCYTDGAKYLADQARAYWLIDDIALAQRYVKRVAAEEFQHWKLTVKADHSATLACDDGNGNVVYAKRIPFTDFPLEETSLYFCNNTVLLPSEY